MNKGPLHVSLGFFGGLYYLVLWGLFHKAFISKDSYIKQLAFYTSESAFFVAQMVVDSYFHPSFDGSLAPMIYFCCFVSSLQ